MDKLKVDQAVVISAYTGILCCDFSDMHKEIERRMGRAVFTHELGNKETWEDIKTLFKDDFVSLVPEK